MVEKNTALELNLQSLLLSSILNKRLIVN